MIKMIIKLPKGTSAILTDVSDGSVMLTAITPQTELYKTIIFEGKENETTRHIVAKDSKQGLKVSMS